MYTRRMSEWIENELTPEQRRKRRNVHTSLFGVWLRQNMGGKNFVMAIWQTGITWAPPAELLNSDVNCALERVATRVASWTRRLARAVTRHKNDERTVEARTRSGDAPGRHGLTPQQVRGRAARKDARVNYYLTLDLHNQYMTAKGRGKGKGEPKLWDMMSREKRWRLKELWEWRLRKALDEAD